MTWVLDCDGVIWLADEVVAGAQAAVERLRRAGERVVFLTNNSWPRRTDHVQKLSSMGIDAVEDDLVTSAMAVAELVEAGEEVLVIGGPGIHEALARRGARPFEAGDGDPTRAAAVVVGIDPSFDYSRLAAATSALRSGRARLIATNGDATFPSPHGVLPGAGSIVAAVATAGGREAVVAGKPNPPIAELLVSQVGAVSMVVGDRPSTDGLLARRLGVPFGLVWTGVTPPDHGDLDPVPDLEARDLSALVALALDHR